MGKPVEIDSEVLAEAQQQLAAAGLPCIRHKLLDVLTAAGLDPDTGRERPLTIRDMAVEIVHGEIRWRASQSRVSLDTAIREGITAEQLAAIRKRLGVEEQTCATCLHGEKIAYNASDFCPRNSYSHWEPRP